MKYIKKFENKTGYFYRIEEKRYLICDTNQCSKSDRTFDIYFFDLVENKQLQKVLFNLFIRKRNVLSEFLARYDKEKTEKLLKNPKLRILVEDPELFLDILSIFAPDDIRVRVRKYNL